jgi:hypothetical protein
MKTTFVPLFVKVSQVVGLALCMTFAPSAAHAQQTSNAVPNPNDATQQLLQRVNELEAKVKQLEAQQAAPAPPPAPAPAPAPEPAFDVPTVHEVAPRLQLTVFGDLGYQYLEHVPNTFDFGSLDLFMRSRLSDNLSTLGEVLFIAQSDNSVGLDVERLLLQYRQSDYLTASVGRYHTWVGYYNTAFNKGEFLETTTDRPFMYAFDDQGGVLPMQEVGLNLTGKIPSGKMGLHYVAEVGNGRAWGLNAEPVQNYQDQNNSKSINGGLFMRPEAISGLQAGFSVRHDNLTIPGPAIGETIATVHFVYINSSYELLNEGALVRHNESGGPVFNTSAFYTQIAHRYHGYFPYFRYQYFNAPSNDPVYVYGLPNSEAPLSVTTFVGRLDGPSAGLRYELSEHSAIKLQYDRFSLRGLPSENGVSSQFAFTF